MELINCHFEAAETLAKDTLQFALKNIEHFENLAKVQAKNDQENISDKLSGVDQGTSYNSNNLVNQEVIETVVVIEYIQTNSRKKIYKSSEDERICRICHLTSEQSSNATTVGTSDSAASANLIQLGCPRKDKLGIAHVHCVEFGTISDSKCFACPSVALCLCKFLSLSGELDKYLGYARLWIRHKHN
ncbi:hypothetical protein GmHk_09G025293 [Glycine max]|nr:hypothetical protein GmHk_09G025293 [Glycine max]